MARIEVGSAAIRLEQRRALIVDDCRFIAERMARVLESRGFECTVVADGYQGLEHIRSRRFDMIVLDANTPMIDGFTLLRHLRRSVATSRTPVLMLSSERTRVDHERASALGASAYMSKPLQLRPLNATLDALLD